MIPDVSIINIWRAKSIVSEFSPYFVLYFFVECFVSVCIIKKISKVMKVQQRTCDFEVHVQ